MMIRCLERNEIIDKDFDGTVHRNNIELNVIKKKYLLISCKNMDNRGFQSVHIVVVDNWTQSKTFKNDMMFVDKMIKISFCFIG